MPLRRRGALGALALLAACRSPEPVLYTLFHYGQFTSFDVRMSALSLLGLSLGLPAFVLAKVLEYSQTVH